MLNEVRNDKCMSLNHVVIPVSIFNIVFFCFISLFGKSYLTSATDPPGQCVAFSMYVKLEQNWGCENYAAVVKNYDPMASLRNFKISCHR